MHPHQIPSQFPDLATQPWKRLWLASEVWDQQSRIDEDFISPWMLNEQSSFATLESFSEVPFLLLLGRPGAGKSQEMQEAYDSRILGSDSVLVLGKEIGSQDPGQVIQESIKAEGPSHADRSDLRILIDGLDEALLQNANFIPQFVRWMKRQKTVTGHQRYRLAISCRWADWPEGEIKELAALWPSKKFKKLVLCPLSEADVDNTLKERYNELEAGRFRRLVHGRHLAPVACWPQGFRNLMTGFESSGCQDLPASLGDSIKGQILRHCQLADTPDDRARWQISVPDKEWRRRVAGRLAAVMIWSGKAVFRLDFLDSPENETSLTSDDLTHTDEYWVDAYRRVELSDLNQLVQRTGLLKRLNAKPLWMFQSQVYQEWLAADWLKTQRLDQRRLREFFGVSGEHGWQVFPKLRAVAAWLARMDPEFRMLLLENDPLTLLLLDAASLSAGERKEVVEALLQATSRARVVDQSITQAHLHSLGHDGLDAQLRLWLQDDRVHDAAKRLAVEIAKQAVVKSLAAFLWDYYPATSGELQNSVARALRRLADDESHEPRWKAVLANEIPSDQHLTLIGTALEMLVLEKRRVPVRHVLDLVLPGSLHGAGGIYDRVIVKIHELITVEDLPSLFAYLGKNPLQHCSIYSSSITRRIHQCALQLSFQNFDLAEVSSSLVKFWYACVSQHVCPHRDQNSSWSPKSIGLENDALRREIIRALISHPGFERHTERRWLNPGDFLFIESDFEWCLDQIMADSIPAEWPYALVVRYYLSWTDLSGEVGRKLEIAWSKSEALRKLGPALPEGIGIVEALASEAAIRRQQHDNETSEDRRRESERDAANQRYAADMLLSCKEGHDRGEIVWPGVLKILHFRYHGTRPFISMLGLEDHVREDEAWMREAAERYLIQRPLKLGLEDTSGVAPLFALAVCSIPLHEAGAVRVAIEKYWLLPLIRAMSESGLEKEAAGLTRQNLATQFPRPFAKAFGEFMSKSYADGGWLNELQLYRGYWTAAMTHELTQLLKTVMIQPKGFARGLQHLFGFSPFSALEVANHWLERFADIQDKEAQAALIGSACIVLEGTLAPQIQPYLSDQAFAAMAFREALATLSHDETRIDLSGWKNDELFHLATTLWSVFPEVNDMFSSRDQAQQFRDHVTSSCRARGLMVHIPRVHLADTPAEALARQQIADWNFHETRKVQAGAGWQVIAPSDFLKLTQMPSARLARDNDELMMAVVECLKQWETSLEHGTWDHLWDVTNVKSRQEKRIAREMCDWLDLKLNVVTECEVELRGNQRTDILIKTITRSALVLSVVVEVKKWRKDNAKERHTNMETQLLDRYLKPRQHEGWTHGLYVVAWTPPPQSDVDNVDAIREASQQLDLQALKLSESPFTLKSMVIDARFRGKLPKSTATGRKQAAKPKRPKA